MRKIAYFLFLFSWAYAEIQLVPVDPTPQPDCAFVRIQTPHDEKIVTAKNLWTSIRMRGYPLGYMSDFLRKNELPNSKLGQSIHIIVDDKPYFAYSGPSADPFIEQGDYFQEIYRIAVRFPLEDGMHTLRVFPARSYGEGLKTLECFDAITFYINEKKIDWAKSLRRPFLTYNEPSHHLTYVEGRPVLVDFYASNCELSKDGYKVRMTIDETHQRLLPELRPYFIYGLGKGNHTIRLELVDAKSEPVPGGYNDITRSFSVR